MFDKTIPQGTENASMPKSLEASKYLALSEFPGFFKKRQIQEQERIIAEIAEAMQPCN